LLKPVLLVLSLALAASAAGEAPKCKFVRLAEWTLRDNYYRPVIDGEINGKKVGVLLDTGAAFSLIRGSAVERLGLSRQWLRGYRAYGVGGETRLDAVQIDEFRIDKWVHRSWRAIVGGEHDFRDDQAVILGEDLLRQSDIEFDLRNKAVRLYQPKDCVGQWLAYWSREALEIPLEGDEKIEFTVAINGRPLRAHLDSGATLSLLAKADAAQRGITPSSPDVVPSGCVTGIAGRRIDSWSARFESFAIGGEVIRNPRIQFADMWDKTYTELGSRLPRQFASRPQMLLGADFLRSHRVLVARSQGKMYFTYEGGTVFAEVPARGCNAPVDKAKPG
jgi:predicted aspartyl protease